MVKYSHLMVSFHFFPLTSRSVLLFSSPLTLSLTASLSLILPNYSPPQLTFCPFSSLLNAFPSLLLLISLLHTNTAFVLNWRALLNKGHPPHNNLLCSTFPFLLLPPAFLLSLPLLSSIFSAACTSLHVFNHCNITPFFPLLQTLVQPSHLCASSLLEIKHMRSNIHMPMCLYLISVCTDLDTPPLEFHFYLETYTSLENVFFFSKIH